MANQTLKNVAAQMPEIDKAIEEAEEVLKFLVDAKESVADVKMDLEKLRTQRDNWKRSLEKSNIKY